MARILNRLVGHRETLATLLGAYEKGRLASTLLFTGPSGVGKRLAALALAQAMVCEKSAAEACGECGSCLRMEKGQSESLLQVVPEGAAIKIEQARDILQFVSLQKLGRARVVVIDQAHLLNPQSGNALLKSLEEPPPGTHFILVTSMPGSVLPTIRSRSQLVRFRPLEAADLQSVLQLVQPSVDGTIDEWVLASAHGSVESALRLLESREEFQELQETVTEYLSLAGLGLPTDAIAKLKELLKDRSAQAFVASLIQGVLRDALRVQTGVEPVDGRAKDLLHKTSMIAPRSLQRLADLSIEIENDFGRNVDRGLILENFAIQWRLAAVSEG